MTPAPLLAIDGLSMRFGARPLFDGLNFSSGPGAVALVGPNGTGKSTLLTLLAGIATPQAGSIRIAGHALAGAQRQAKARLAYVPDESVAYEFMTGAEFLAMVDALRGTRDAPRATPLLAGLGLDAHTDKRFGAMSLGTRKKFMLAAGLMGDAAVVLMDEPTNGIDAAAKAWLADLIRQQAASRLLLFSTHDQALIDATDARLLRLG